MTNNKTLKSLPVLVQYENVLDLSSMALMRRPQSKLLLQQKMPEYGRYGWRNHLICQMY